MKGKQLGNLASVGVEVVIYRLYAFCNTDLRDLKENPVESNNNQHCNIQSRGELGFTKGS